MELIRKPICIRMLFCAIVLLIGAHSSLATTVIIPADDQMIIEARAIIRGKVLAIESGIDSKQNAISTYVTVKVQEVLKGQITERKIVLKQPGGQYGGRGSVVFGAPEFEIGENTILYLDTWRDGSLRVHQMLLGKFSVIKDPNSGALIAVRNTGSANVQILGHSETGPITNRMELSAYLGMVRSRLVVNRKASRSFEARAYENVPFFQRPKGFVSSPSGDISPEFHIWNPPIRWFEADDGQSVVFKVNTENAPPQVESDVIAATNAWSSVPGCSLRVVEGGTTNTCGLFAFDGTNSISFNNCDGYFSGSGTCTAGILAVTSISNFDRNQTRVVNGVTFYRAIEANLTFNPFASCAFADHCQLQEIITHEMGHALGLHHSWDSSFGGTPTLSDQQATMYWVAHFDGRCASLRQDDINGITFIYPAVGGGPGPLNIVSTSPLGTGTVGSVFSRQLIASGGTTPYVWSLVSGSLPDGLQMSSTGAIGGTPTVAGTFDFTVKVTDAQSTSVQKPLQIAVVTPATGYDAQFVSQTVASTLQPNQAFFATIRWLNTGSTSWDGGNGFVVLSQNPENNVTWGGNVVPWVGPPVAPGQTMELTFQAFAPSRAGIYNFQWQPAHQLVGFFGQMSANVSITVGDPGQPAPLTIGGPSTLSPIQGVLFTNTLSASGGTPPYVWSVAVGSLPAGIALNPTTGTLTGAATAVGNFSATVQVADSKSQTAQKALSFTVTSPPVEVATSALPGATRGVNFSQQLTAAGGKSPYNWSVTAGSLPGGLTLAGSTGVISGTPTATGSFAFTVTVTDSDSHNASKPLSITVIAPPLLVASIPNQETMMGSAFTYQPSASGGTAPYTWSVNAASMPPGLVMNGSTGTISGTPTAAGQFSVLLTVRDASSTTASATAQIKVIDPATLPLITKVKYKNQKKLFVIGDRFNQSALLFVDGNQLAYELVDGQLLVKPIRLASGTHQIKVVNPGGSSPVYVLNVP
jgi:hypothetical protein